MRRLFAFAKRRGNRMKASVAGECATARTELDVGHGTVRMNVDISYIVIKIRSLEEFWKAGLTDSG